MTNEPMRKITKQEILNAIRQTAKENGGKPLGKGRFEKLTILCDAGANSEFNYPKKWI